MDKRILAVVGLVVVGLLIAVVAFLASGEPPEANNVDRAMGAANKRDSGTANEGPPKFNDSPTNPVNDRPSYNREPSFEQLATEGDSEATPQKPISVHVELVPEGWPEDYRDFLALTAIAFKWQGKTVSATASGGVFSALVGVVDDSAGSKTPATLTVEVAVMSARLTADFVATAEHQSQKRQDGSLYEGYALPWPNDTLATLRFTFAGDTSGLPGGFVGVEIGTSSPMLALVPTSGAPADVMVEPGKIRIRKPKDSFGYEATVEVDGKEIRRVTVEAGEVVPVTLNFGSSLKGQRIRVVDGEGNPVASVRVKLVDVEKNMTGFASVATDERGETTVPFPGLDGPTTSEYAAQIASGDVVTSELRFDVAEDSTVELVVETGKPTAITIQAADGTPLRFLEVSVTGAGKKIKRYTDTQGIATFAAFREGERLELVLSDGFKLDAGDDVVSGDTITLRVETATGSLSKGNVIRAFRDIQARLAQGSLSPRDAADMMSREIDTLDNATSESPELAPVKELIHALRNIR